MKTIHTTWNVIEEAWDTLKNNPLAIGAVVGIATYIGLHAHNLPG